MPDAPTAFPIAVPVRFEAPVTFAAEVEFQGPVRLVRTLATAAGQPITTTTGEPVQTIREI